MHTCHLNSCRCESWHTMAGFSAPCLIRYKSRCCQACSHRKDGLGKEPLRVVGRIFFFVAVEFTQDGFRKGKGMRDQTANIRWIIKKAREFQKNIYFCFSDYAKAFDCVDHNTLWKILKEMGIPDHLTCLLRSLYAGQEATVRTGQGTTDWFQIGKGIHQGYILSPCLFNLYAEYIMRNAGLEEAQAGIRLLGEISIISDMQITAPLWQKSKRN